jgi:hypothetical protein
VNLIYLLTFLYTKSYIPRQYWYATAKCKICKTERVICMTNQHHIWFHLNIRSHLKIVASKSKWHNLPGDCSRLSKMMIYTHSGWQNHSLR